ncbi:MAG: molybdopterin-dependent oxidoreductase [Deltaproteobacteria bacterium]|nr:molybdopterin-dependent oxidoreductase [Deltaproteobacteria bacterium]
MADRAHVICPLCEATCGLTVEHDGERLLSVRGDEQDPFSRGHLCPKAVALKDLHEDPDRLKRPLLRDGTGWRELSWEEALDLAAARLAEVQARHGRDAVALYAGNPVVHNYGAIFYGLLLDQVLGSRHRYTSNSVDAWPRMLVSYLLYGNQTALPVPDLERTRFLLVLGANPAVSNGSIMTAPGAARRLKELRQRGGRLVVVDPRRTETARLADQHLFIRPGSDAYFLAALLHVVLKEGRARPGALAPRLEGFSDLAACVERFTPEAVALRTGISAAETRALALAFTEAESAVCYGRLGTCVQRHGVLATWLIDLLNLVTGNVDRPGGAMFGRAPVDLPATARRLGQAGSYGRYRSRVSGLPEIGGELPAATLAEELETPGPGQIRALVTHAGNPVLSLPNGPRLERALAGVEFLLSIDIYLNETTRHAHLILPPTFGLEHDHYSLLFSALSVRTVAHYSPAVLRPADGSREEWEILLELSTRLLARRGLAGSLGARALRAVGGRLGAKGLLDLSLRTGPYGLGRSRGPRLSLAALRKAPHGLDLGPLESRLPELLGGDGRIPLLPAVLTDALARLDLSPGQGPVGPASPSGELLLIGRRSLRSNNSWMHNSPRLTKGREACTLLAHPADASARGLTDGALVRVRSRVGEVRVPLEVSNEMMPGVVSLPHGYGHGRPGTALRVANQRPGVSANELTDDAVREELSGAGVLFGVPVELLPG